MRTMHEGRVSHASAPVLTGEVIPLWSRSVTDGEINGPVSAPTAWDFNGDHIKDICITTKDGYIMFFDGISGNDISGNIRPALELTPPCILPLDRHTAAVIIGGYDGKSFVKAVSWDMQIYWSTSAQSISAPPNSAPYRFNDITGDGIDEILITDRKDTLYCIGGGDGTIIWRWKSKAGSIIPFIGIGDVNNDAIQDACIGTENGNVYSIDGLTGNAHWVYNNSVALSAPPLIADSDTTPGNEIHCQTADGRITILSCAGKLIRMLNFSSPLGGSLIAGDIDRNNSYDVLWSTAAQGIQMMTDFNHAAGTLQWNYTALAPVQAPMQLIDLNADTLPELCVIDHTGQLLFLGTRHGICAGSFQLGSEITQPFLLMDFDNDPRFPELAVTTKHGTVEMFTCQFTAAQR